MSTLPLTEAILLEIHQSLGNPGHPTTKKNKFATGNISLESHKDMGKEILKDIFEALGMDSGACLDAIDNLLEFGGAYKDLELNTWTFDADRRQILWMLLGYFYIPGMARRAAFWSIDSPLDKGMPGGRFWYLPEPRDGNSKHRLYLPVAQVVDWLLDLLGMPLEEFADERNRFLENPGDNSTENMIRSLYNWRKETIPSRANINEYFYDDLQVTFKGAFTLDRRLSHAEQFSNALDFVARKQLNAERLRLEIPMTQSGRLEAILDGRASENEQVTFVEYLAERYVTPSPRIIRQRLLFARMMQDGYVRLLKYLCPGVDRRCADARQNKLLQLFGIYKLVYNLTIDARHKCKDQGEDAENDWFEEHLPLPDKDGLFLAILPSRRETCNRELAHFLTRYFYCVPVGAELEDHVAIDVDFAMPIIKRNVDRATSIADELSSELHLVERMKKSSPWRALQDEHRYWVVSQVTQHPGLSPRAKEAAIQRLRELAETPAETVQTILLELDGYLNGECKQWTKNTRSRVQALLDEAEASEGYELWRAAILQYKAKHLLACNDFKVAGKLFREALEAGRERNYGPLRGEVSRDCLAIEVANQKLIKNNHEKYYREMLAGGIVEGSKVPSIEDAARWAADYFWNTLYKPYPGVERVTPLAQKKVEESLKLLMAGDQEGLLSWIKYNHNKLNCQLPLVTGDSLLIHWIKGRTHFLHTLHSIQRMTPTELQGDLHCFEVIQEHWRHAIGILAQKAPKQLGIVDYKRQTPLMLIAEAGDTELVGIMLQAGADPDMQDWQGMTALHSAIKSGVDSCIDVLLDHPCQLDKFTSDGRSPLHTAGWSANLHATRRLLRLAPELAWQRDAQNMTPLEYVEYLVENPGAWQALADNLRQSGRRAASKKELVDIIHLLEKAEAVS